MISSITNRGKVGLMLYRETMTAKVFLILDNLRLHHSKIVNAWLDENREQIEDF